MTTLSYKLAEDFRSRVGKKIYNTSYPLDPSEWTQYLIKGRLDFDLSKPIAFYVHIPFCRQLCAFCEYSKTTLPSDEQQGNYIKRLREDIDMFLRRNSHIMLYGFDIGGGTPTALEISAFTDLISLYKDVVNRTMLTPGFEPSIEGTFETLNSQKATLIADVGIHRISLGVQSSSNSVLAPLKRNALDIGRMKNVMTDARNSGIMKINLDLMYGLPGQTVDSIEDDISVIERLRPEQVTVYEFRTNQLQTHYQCDGQISYAQYYLLFDGLTELGYHGEFGQNTFSLCSKDKGLSSYLRHRMFDGWQYKGFGLSAQSMSQWGLSYNSGKNSKRIREILDASSYEADSYYALPSRELFAKYVAICGYSGGFSLKTAREIYGSSFDEDFKETITTFIKMDLMVLRGERLCLTKEGYKHYGAIMSMFYYPSRP